MILKKYWNHVYVFNGTGKRFVEESYFNSFRQQVELGISKIHTAMTGIQKSCAECKACPQTLMNNTSCPTYETIPFRGSSTIHTHARMSCPDDTSHGEEYKIPYLLELYLLQYRKRQTTDSSSSYAYVCKYMHSHYMLPGKFHVNPKKTYMGYTFLCVWILGVEILGISIIRIFSFLN